MEGVPGSCVRRSSSSAASRTRPFESVGTSTMLDVPRDYLRKTMEIPDDRDDLPEEEREDYIEQIENAAISFDPTLLKEEILQIGRLIEVDLPIKRISEHARREKSIRHGHVSTLHIWWARRPLAACRAVICASLWPDPADPLCPEAFRKKARELIFTWATQHLGLAS